MAVQECSSRTKQLICSSSGWNWLDP